MRCPQCGQDMTPTDQAACSLCGVSVQSADPVRSLYTITSALFLSTLVYAMLVFFMEQSPHPATASADLQGVLPFVMLGLAPVIFVIGQVTATRVAQSLPIAAAIIECAAAEACCILGLVLYFVLHSIAWFVILLGISWLMFLFTAIRIPRYAALLAKRRDHTGRSASAQTPGS